MVSLSSDRVGRGIERHDLVKTTFVSAYDSVAYDLVKTRLSDSLAEAMDNRKTGLSIIHAEAEELRPRPRVTGYF